ncbi:ABC transporter ATP-binding protein [Amorphus sp. 3PC139-8]|uniref:ABC transporter ATP-binding protein n=1 Tax=Amorphus sp. 3PC139-8 TaxID=2735676 RepID=UPI00345C826B
MALLEIDRLSVSIGGHPILSDVSLSVAPGATLGIVGESGSGKSMTALSVMRLLPPGMTAKGAIRLQGEDLFAKSEREMCRIRGGSVGLVFQEPMTALNPVRPIGDQIAEAVRLHLPLSRADTEARVLRLLDRVGLTRAKVGPERYPHQLSGGQRQRVVIAIAIAADPKLVIADEATTALDVTVQAQILTLLREVAAAEGAALVLITHDLAVVADMAERIAVMRDGRVVEEAPTLELFRHPRQPATRELIAASDYTPERLPSPTVDTPVLVAADDVVRAHRLTRPGLFRPRPMARVLDTVSVEIRAGESIGIVGESGAGKSTLARAVLALDRPNEGTIRFRGRDLFALSAGDLRRTRAEIQAVFQDPYGSFDPRHTVARIVAEPLHLLAESCPSAERKRRVEEALERVGLPANAGLRYPHEFSGGQRQRIAIARAIVTRPALVVADEPVSALDVTLRGQILDLFAELRRDMGLALLFISHDLAVVRATTDRVYVMKDGQIVEHGETETVFHSPRHSYTRALIDASPSLERALAKRAAARE